MKVPLQNISAILIQELAELHYATPHREVAEDIVEKINIFRKTHEVGTPSFCSNESSSSKKRKLSEEEIPLHAGDSSSFIDSQGSSTKSAFEKPPVQDIPMKISKTMSSQSSSTTCIFSIVFSLVFLIIFFRFY